MTIRIGIIFGGRSGEHEISIRSAKTVIEQIDKEKYEVFPILITPEGRWASRSESLQVFPASVRASIGEMKSPFDNKPLELIGSRISEGSTTELDVVFPVLHGTFGEDGTIQGLFEMFGVPYVGCGVLASSCGMDKAVMKTLFREAGLPICKYVWFLRHEWEQEPASVMRQIESNLGYPCFVKPANLGSSVGVSRANNEEELRKAIDLAALYDGKMLVEECLDMRELECAVIGNDDPRASQPGEYIIRDESKKFLDYTEKYTGTGNNEFVVPAPISNELVKKVCEMAIKAFKAIDGSGLARVDFFLRSDNGELLVNEINTMPGLTDASGFPKMWAGTGVSFPEVIDQLVDLALERNADRSRNLTRFDTK